MHTKNNSSSTTDGSTVIELFFALVQCGIGKRKDLPRTPNAQEWSELFDIVQKQTLTGIAFAGIEVLAISFNVAVKHIETGFVCQFGRGHVPLPSVLKLTRLTAPPCSCVAMMREQISSNPTSLFLCCYMKMQLHLHVCAIACTCKCKRFN